MKLIRLTSMLLLALLAMSAGSCQSSDWDDLPGTLSQFIDRYFNDTDIESYSDSNGHYVVTIKNGAMLTFNSSYEWTDIDGRGNTLPDILLEDQLPDTLYDFIVNLEVTNGVYRLERDFHEIRVKLLDTDILYDRQTGAITYPSAPA